MVFGDNPRYGNVLLRNQAVVGRSNTPILAELCPNPIRNACDLSLWCDPALVVASETEDSSWMTIRNPGPAAAAASAFLWRLLSLCWSYSMRFLQAVRLTRPLTRQLSAQQTAPRRQSKRQRLRHRQCQLRNKATHLTAKGGRSNASAFCMAGSVWPMGPVGASRINQLSQFTGVSC